MAQPFKRPCVLVCHATDDSLSVSLFDLVRFKFGALKNPSRGNSLDDVEHLESFETTRPARHNCRHRFAPKNLTIPTPRHQITERLTSETGLSPTTTMNSTIYVHKTNGRHTPTLTKMAHHHSYSSPPISPTTTSATTALRSPVWSPPSSVASSPPYSPISFNSDELESIEVEAADLDKSETQKHRERGANLRALKLLDQDVAGEKYKRTSPVSPTGSSGSGLSARQAAIARYEEERKARKEAEAKLREEMKLNRPKPILVPPKRPERMAETTRKVPKGPEDVRDPETIAGMKCRADWDRQKYAEHMALELVSSKYGKETSIV